MRTGFIKTLSVMVTGSLILWAPLVVLSAEQVESKPETLQQQDRTNDSAVCQGSAGCRGDSGSGHPNIQGHAGQY